jgi:hypothetical protein
LVVMMVSFADLLVLASLDNGIYKALKSTDTCFLGSKKFTLETL